MTAADETVRKNLNDEISEFVRRNDRNLEQIGRRNWKRLTGRTSQGFWRPWSLAQGMGAYPHPYRGEQKG